MAGASILGGVMQANAANRASQAQERSANRQMDIEKQIYDETTARFQPFYQSGKNALNAYDFELGLGDRPEGYGGFTATPGYDFRFNQGIGAIDASAASKGNLMSGATQQALTQFGQGIASEEYGNHLNRLYGQMSSGQAAAGNQAAAGQNYATGMGNALGNLGNAQAAGAIAQGNAWSGATNNLTNALMFNHMMA